MYTTKLRAIAPKKSFVDTAFHFGKPPFHFGRVKQILESLGKSLKFPKALLRGHSSHLLLNQTNSGIPFGIPVLKIMLSLILLAAGLICFWILYKCIDWFENI